MSSINSASRRPTPPSIDGTSSRRHHSSGGYDSGSSYDSGSLGSDTYNSGRPTPPPVNRPTPPPVDRPVPPPVDRPVPPPVDRPVPPPVDRPVPPPVDRPVPPPVDRPVDRPVPPLVDPGTAPYSDPTRPVPPPVHVPRYYWQPTFPMILPSNPQPLPQLSLPPSPAPARKVDKSEVSSDVVDLLAGYGRLRSKSSFLWVTTHPKLDAQKAKDALNNGQTIYLAPDDGSHGNGSYQPINNVSQLQPLLPQVQQQKLGDMQANENRAYQQRVNQWVDQDVQNRINNLPAFNSIYDMNRLNMDNMMVTDGGRNFNRNLITAMNVYQQYDVKQEIAQKWHDNPDMSTSEFNNMANSVITSHIQSLFWDANYQGDYGTYLGSNPVPGLRYPDTQEDIDWNVQTIQRVASEDPMLLSGAVQNY